VNWAILLSFPVAAHVAALRNAQNSDQWYLAQDYVQTPEDRQEQGDLKNLFQGMRKVCQRGMDGLGEGEPTRLAKPQLERYRCHPRLVPWDEGRFRQRAALLF
jgi:hypothetical protein